jgi:hypothetical protein
MMRRLVLVAVLLAVVAISLISSTGHASAGIVWCRNCTNSVMAGDAC